MIIRHLNSMSGDAIVFGIKSNKQVGWNEQAETREVGIVCLLELNARTYSQTTLKRRGRYIVGVFDNYVKKFILY